MRTRQWSRSVLGVGSAFLAALLLLHGNPGVAVAQAQLPDLTILSLAMDSECRIRITMRNEGPGPLAADVFSNPPVLGFWFNGVTKGQWVVDSQTLRALQAPGGIATDTTGPLLSSSASVQVKVDVSERIAEAREDNNTLTQTLTCATPLPDVAVTNLALDTQCRPVVTLTNVGTIPLPDDAYGSYATVQFYDGSSAAGAWGLSQADPQRLLKTPGGTVTFTRPTETVGVTGQWRVTVSVTTTESRVDNNALMRSLPCAAGLPDPQIASVEFTTTCQAKVRLVNGGTGKVSDSAFTSAVVQRFINEQPAGQVTLMQIDPTRSLQQPGGVREWLDGAAPWAGARVQYQLGNVMQDKDWSNNVRQASVPSQCTQPIADTVAPQLGSVTVTPTALAHQGGEVALSVRASDNVGIGRVLITQIKPNGEQNSGIVPLVSGAPTNGEWQTKWTIAGNSSTTAQTYTIKVKVNDAAGNAAEAQPIHITVAAGSAGSSPQHGLQPSQGAATHQTPQAATQIPQATQGPHVPQPQGPLTPQGLQTLQSPQAKQTPQTPQTQRAPQAPQPAASAAQGAWLAMRPATAQDAPLAQSLNARLQESSRGWGVAARNVNIEVANGAVRLTGKVATAQERASLEASARSTQGVRSVTNAITVGP